MKKHQILILTCCCTWLLLQSQADSGRQMCITIDDLPVVSRDTTLHNHQEITSKIIEALVSRQAWGIGFVNESKLYRKGTLLESRKALLRQWLDAGLLLGNHTYAHKDYHQVSFEVFSKDILEGEPHTRSLLEAKGLPLLYFRHPFLHTGNSPEKKQQLSDFLKSRQYIEAPVTIDNAEYIFARAYDDACIARDSSLMKRLGTDYLEYMLAKIAFFEQQTQQLFEREIPHILLIHANHLNADYLGLLMDRLALRSYRFVSLQETLADPAYASMDTFTGNGGITWLHRWALTRKVDKSFFAGEPPCPDYVQQLTGIRE